MVAFNAQRDAETLDASLAERRQKLVATLAGQRQAAWDALYAEYWNDHYKPINGLYLGAIKRADEKRDAALAPLETERVKRNVAYRKTEAAADSIEEIEKAIAAVRRWQKLNYDPKVDAIRVAHAKAVKEADKAFKEANGAAYKKYCVRNQAMIADWRKLQDELPLLQDMFAGLALADSEAAALKAPHQVRRIRALFADWSADLDGDIAQAAGAALKSEWPLAWRLFDEAIAPAEAGFEFSATVSDSDGKRTLSLR